MIIEFCAVTGLLILIYMSVIKTIQLRKEGKIQLQGGKLNENIKKILRTMFTARAK